MAREAGVRQHDDAPEVSRVAARIAGRVLWASATGLCIIALPLVLVFGAVRFAFSWQPVYTYAVTAYHADDVTGVPVAGLLAATHEIRNYFTNDARDLDIRVTDRAGDSGPLFNEREIAHMRDVKALVGRVYLLLDGSVAVVLAYAALSLIIRRDSQRRLARAMLVGALATVALVIGLGTAALFGFDQLFTEFHVLSFSNDFWELDPTRDHLVQIFPQGFWFDITMFVGLVALLAAVAVATLSGSYLLLTRGTGSGRQPRA